jgi:hypothetical protein
MNELFSQAYKKLCEEHQSVNDFLLMVRGIADLESNLLDALEEARTNEDWGCICKLLWVVERRPSRKFTLFLSDLLDNSRHDVFMEALVDALTLIKDERSVPSLLRALNYYVVGDDLAYHFNRKVIQALANIGTEDAIEGIRKALSDPREPIRAEAEKTLRAII